MKSHTHKYEPTLLLYSFVGVVVAVLHGAGALSCSAVNVLNDEVSDDTPTGEGGDRSSGSGGNAATPDGGPGLDAETPDGLPDTETCAAEVYSAEPIPLDMFFLVDRSESMGNGYWTPVTSALAWFFEDQTSAGIHVGMNLFPFSGQTGSCDPASYHPVQTPDNGGLAELPTDAWLLKNALGIYPGGQTPMYGALDGTLQSAIAYQIANPSHEVVVVLISDGMPTSSACNAQYGGTQYGEIATIAQLAEQAYLQEGIETYCVVIDPNAAQALEAIAMAGGTEQAYDVSSNIAGFVTKMIEIREVALGCEYLIPSQQEQDFDPHKVNLVYTPGDGDAPQNIPKVQTEAACGTLDGWYYDIPTAPQRIILCPATCDTVQSDTHAAIDIAYGCPYEGPE